MEKVRVYHPVLDRSREVEPSAARVMERSGWQIEPAESDEGQGSSAPDVETRDVDTEDETPDL